MQKTAAALNKIHKEGKTDDEAVTILKKLGEDELVDFILWHFNRGKFNNLIKK